MTFSPELTVQPTVLACCKKSSVADLQTSVWRMKAPPFHQIARWYTKFCLAVIGVGAEVVATRWLANGCKWSDGIRFVVDLEQKRVLTTNMNQCTCNSSSTIVWRGLGEMWSWWRAGICFWLLIQQFNGYETCLLVQSIIVYVAVNNTNGPRRFDWIFLLGRGDFRMPTDLRQFFSRLRRNFGQQAFFCCPICRSCY